MKTEKACRLIARIPNNRQGRAALAVLRKSINRTTYKLRVLFSGPRSTYWCTHKEDATVMRVYLDHRAMRPTVAADMGALRQKLSASEYIIERMKEDREARKREVDVLIREVADAKAIARDALTRELAATKRLNEVPFWILWLVGFVRGVKAKADVPISAAEATRRDFFKRFSKTN